MLHIAAGAGNAGQGAVGHQVGLPPGPVGDVAFAQFADHGQRRRRNGGQLVRQVLVGQVGQSFQRYMAGGLAHLPDVPFVVFRRGVGADPAAAGGAGPSGNAFLRHQPVVIAVGVHAGKVVGRGAGRNGVQPFRVLPGEL